MWISYQNHILSYYSITVSPKTCQNCLLRTVAAPIYSILFLGSPSASCDSTSKCPTDVSWSMNFWFMLGSCIRQQSKGRKNKKNSALRPPSHVPKWNHPPEQTLLTNAPPQSNRFKGRGFNHSRKPTGKVTAAFDSGPSTTMSSSYSKPLRSNQVWVTLKGSWNLRSPGTYYHHKLPRKKLIFISSL